MEPSNDVPVGAPWLKSYEALVDELLLEHPDEKLVQLLMKEVGLVYSQNQVERVSLVFEKMNALLKGQKERKGTNDLPKYS